LAPKAAPAPIPAPVSNVDDGMDVFGLTSAKPTKPHGNDSFDFPSLKHPTQPTQQTSTITPLQPPPARSALVKPSPIVNVMMNPQPPKPSKGIPDSDGPACPICGTRFNKDITNSEINRHVDTCLNSSAIEGISTGAVNPTKRDSVGSSPTSVRKSSPFRNSSESHTQSEPWGQWFDLSKMDWYYGAIDRQDAEKTLFKCLEDSFLVRKSSVKDSFALSLYNHKKQTVTHTLIEPRNGGYAFQDHTRVYPTMVDLVTKSPECGGLKAPPRSSSSFRSDF